MNSRKGQPTAAPCFAVASRKLLAVAVASLFVVAAEDLVRGQESKNAQPTPAGAGANRGTERVPLPNEGPVDYHARWAVIIGIDK